MASTLGTKIKEARKSAGLSPEQLAVALNVSVATLFRIERGTTDVTVGRLWLIAHETGHPVAYFLNNSEEAA